MKTYSILIKKEDFKVYRVYLGDDRISYIKDYLKYTLFFILSTRSYLEINIEDNVYILKCTNSGSAGERFTEFSLLSQNEKEIAKIKTTTNFFQSVTWNTFFTRNNRINYFQHEHSSNKSGWRDENKKDVLIYVKNTLTYDDSIFIEKIELYLLISLTLCIEKLILKKERIGLMKSVLSAMVLIPIILIIISILVTK